MVYEFSAAITPVFSVTWLFRNHSDMLIWCSKNIINVENNFVANYKILYIYFFLNITTDPNTTITAPGSVQKNSLNSICGLMFIKINFHLSLVFFKKAKM